MVKSFDGMTNPMEGLSREYDGSSDPPPRPWSLLSQPLFIAQELRKARNKPVSGAEVYAAEKAESILRFERLSRVSSEPPVPFSVAFSGGGVRAAAFNSGVLWRLAKEGILKDMEHLSVVSGGAYVGTSYITFLLAGISESRNVFAHGDASRTEDINEWYQKVVWRTIERMQTNIACLARFTKGAQSAGARSQLKGILSLCCMTFLCLVLLPLMNFLLFTAPLTILLDQMAGDAMRTAVYKGNGKPETFRGTKLELILFTMSAGSMWLAIFACCCQAILVWLRRLHRLADSARQSTAVGLGMRFFFSLRNVLAFCAFACISVVLLAFVSYRLQSWMTHKYPDVVLERKEWSIYAGFCMFWAILFIAFGFLAAYSPWRCLSMHLTNVVGVLVFMYEFIFVALMCSMRVFRTNAYWWDILNHAVSLFALLTILSNGMPNQLLHIWIRRSLRKAFYHNGEDVLLTDPQGVSVCPNLIVAATLIDYCRLDQPEKTTHYSGFYFTQRMMGGDRTGFIDAPVGLTLSSVMALSAAALDAFLTTKFDALWVRVSLLGFLNIRMGDYVAFRSNWQQGLWCARFQSLCVNIILFLPFVSFWFMPNADVKNSMFLYCTFAAGLFWGASFFTSIRVFRWLNSSKIIRKFHMIMGHYCISDEPPLQLFLNDGGLVECLGLIALLRRRCSYMMVTDSTADPDMQLVSLRECIDIAKNERICTFFDMEDPRRGFEPLIAEFSAGNGTYLRIGVLYDCYGQSPSFCTEGKTTGEIVFVRMRLFQPGVLTTVPCRVSEQEVLQGIPHQPPTSSIVGAVAEETIGGCCCESIKFCNCGLLGRFPDISTGNQFLTPTHFTMLCRLGYQATEDAVKHIKQLQSQHRRMERHPSVDARSS
eukprot:TRINITY_DN14203_c0_g1_i1.p1 TRINITY_DN14203_c0_g1~~TRINITY_DN14203_c0_g1_i1.p1  ORF type:complete len:880 (-),score=111.73 TRINITY_DN14203_c0_g1_i1:89-2728(-)